jgi:hypothetical protein
MKIVRQKPKKWELYDLAKDLSETKDLSGSRPEELERLLKEWENIDAKMVAPLFK